MANQPGVRLPFDSGFSGNVNPGTRLPFDSGFSGNVNPGTRLPFDESFGGNVNPGTFLPFDQGFQQQSQTQNPAMELLKLLLSSRQPSMSQQSNLATDKAVQPQEAKKKEAPADFVVPTDQWPIWAKKLGLAIEPITSVIGGLTGRFKVQGIFHPGKVTRSDFIRAFEEKQKDLVRRQTDPLNRLRATDVTNQVFGETDLSGLSAQKTGLEQIRNDETIRKQAFDLTEELKNQMSF